MLPFYILIVSKKNFLIFLKIKSFIYISLFIVLYFLIRFYFIDVDLPISGGWSFKVFNLLSNYNYILSEIIFFFISLFSFFLIFFYFNFFIKSVLNKLILLFLILFPLSMEIVFQEYFDPLMLFVIIFFIHKDDIKIINFGKSFLVFQYFLIFWISSLSYYLLIWLVRPEWLELWMGIYTLDPQPSLSANFSKAASASD